MTPNKCLFCSILSDDSQVLNRTRYFTVLVEARPVSPGHMLMISNRHAIDAFALSKDEWQDFGTALSEAKKLISSEHSPDGYNVGMNCGETAGQSQMHFHAHVIPRYEGDVADPKGGVRNIMDSYIPPKE